VRRIRYKVAASLDGFIAGPDGEADWIATDPDVDFNAIFKQFDTLLVGRRTFEGMAQAGRATVPGMKTIVFSRTLQQSAYPDVNVISDNWPEVLTDLRTIPGKDIWLFGGGSLFKSLLERGFVDTVEVAIMPVLLGGGITLLPPPADRAILRLTHQKVYKTGIVLVEYAVAKPTA
jgi:dihydrofolate reductase